MAFSFIQYVGDGTTTIFQVPFSYLDPSHVSVKVNGVAASFTWQDSTHVVISPAPPLSQIVEIRRTTPEAAAEVVFQDGSVLGKEDLNNAVTQLLYIAQEATDAATTLVLNATNQIDAQNHQIINVVDPTAAQHAATKNYVDNLGVYAAEQYASQSQASATASAGSATQSAASATAAAGSASAAASSSTAAGNSATSASNYAAQAASSASTLNAPTPATSSGVQEFLRVKADKTGYELATPGTALKEILAGSPMAGFRNRIINGDMRLNQRAGATYAGPNGYTLDRMYVNRDGGVAGVTASQQWENFGGVATKYWLLVQRNSGDTSTAEYSVFQPIEGLNTFDFWDNTVTMSVNACAAGTGVGQTFTLELWWNASGADVGPSGSGWNVLTSSAFTLTGGPTLYQASFSVPSSARQVMARIHGAVASGTAGSNEQYYFTEWQLEPGAVATPFERRPLGVEVSLCQRYFEVLSGPRSVCGQQTSGAGTYTTWFFKNTKRVSPSFNFQGGSVYDALDSYGVDGVTAYKGNAACVIGQASQAIAELS